MIIRREGAFYEFYAQVDHAALAAELAAHYGAQGFAQEHLHGLAIQTVRLHDSAWSDVDCAPVLCCEGQPRDFLRMPAQLVTGIWSRSISTVENELGPLSAMVVSRHFVRLARMVLASNHRPQEECEIFSSFIATQQSRQEAWKATLAPSATLNGACSVETQVERMGALLQACDMISVFLLGFGEGLPVMENGSAQETRFQLRRISPRELLVEPWPFTQPRIELSIPCKILPVRRYRDDQDLQAEYASAQVKQMRFAVRQ